MYRARFYYVAAALTTIVVGLLVHGSDVLQASIRDVAADALWAMMVTWWVGALLPTKSLAVRAGIAIAIAWVVEVTQLYRAPWLDSWRSSRLVHLVLGSDFDSRDLLSYAIGVAATVLLELSLRKPARQRVTE